MPRRLPLRWFALVAALLLGFMIVEFVTTLTGASPALTLSGARDLVGSCSRSLNQLVALIFLSVALAVPIAATGYTPRLIGVFIRDRLHQLVLAFYALAAIHANWVMFLLRREPADEWMVVTVLVSTSLGFIIVVPYFFYVIHFLEPRTVIDRIRAMALRAAARAPRSAADQARARGVIPRSVYHLGGVVLKSIDRVDRRTAVQGIAAIRQMLDAFGGVKETLAPQWFAVTAEEFPGLSRDALRFISEDRSWVEVSAFRQLVRTFEYSLTRLPDVLSALAEALEGIALEARAREDDDTVMNAIRTFNTFLRTSVRNRAPHAVFYVLAHYRALAQELAREQPSVTVSIAGYLAWYGALARRTDLEFIPELFAYDLGGVLRSVVETEAEAKAGVLEVFLAYLRELSAKPTATLACTALVTLGGLLGKVEEAELDGLIAFLASLPPNLVGDALERIESTTRMRYWEMTDRQEDFNYLPPGPRAALANLVRDRIPRMNTDGE